MSHYRNSRITVNYSRAKDTFTFLGGNLVQRGTEQGVKFFIEGVVNGQFIYQAGIKSEDRLVTVNYRDVEGLDHDALLESIRCLNPLMLGVERTVDGATVPAVGVLDIAIGDDFNPFAKFAGFFYNTTIDTVRELIPLDVPELYVYSYLNTENNVYYKTTSGGKDYWLSTDGSTVSFGENKTPGTSQFKKYIYNFATNPKRGKEPVILVPASHTDLCLAATKDNILKLGCFCEKLFTGPIIPGNDRFLFREGSAGQEFTLESSVAKGFYITRADDDSAIMTSNGSKLTELVQTSE